MFQLPKLCCQLLYPLIVSVSIAIFFLHAEEKQMADNQQQEIEQLQRKVSELQGELKTELKHSKSTDGDTHVRFERVSK